MATWSSSGSTSWNTASNWTPAAVPGPGDAVVFDGTSVVNCTCDVAIDIAQLNVAAGYSGVLDLSDTGYSHGITGDCVFGGTGTADLGTSTLTVGGNFANNTQSIFLTGVSNLVLTGSVKTITSNVKSLYRLTVEGSYSTVGLVFYTFLDVSGEFTVNSGNRCTNGDVNVTATGTLNGSDILSLRNGVDFSIDPGGTCSVELATLGSGPITFIGVTTSRFSVGGDAGTEHRLVGNFEVGNLVGGTSASIFNVNGFELGIVGLVSQSSGMSWTLGSGTVNIKGTSNQNLMNFNDNQIPDLVVSNTSFPVQFTKNLLISSYTQAPGTAVQGAYLLTMPGNFEINGTVGQPCTFTDVDLNVTGAIRNAYYTTVTNSDASAGSDINAFDSTDGGGNPGWIFGGAPAPAAKNPVMVGTEF